MKLLSVLSKWNNQKSIFFHPDNIDYLPEETKRQIRIIVSLIKKEMLTVQIRLFGEYTSNEYKVMENPHFRFLIIYSDIFHPRYKAEAKLRKAIAMTCGKELRLNLIYQSEWFVRHSLRNGSPFITNIFHESKVLYGTKTIKEEQMVISSDNVKRMFDQSYHLWYDFASASYEGLKLMYSTAKLNERFQRKIAFDLHQVVEHLYGTILAVHVGVTPRSHNLIYLRQWVNNILDDAIDVFPLESKRDKHLFQVLQNAYKHSRYSYSFSISQEDIEELWKRTQKLKEIVQRKCQSVAKMATAS